MNTLDWLGVGGLAATALSFLVKMAVRRFLWKVGTYPFRVAWRVVAWPFRKREKLTEDEKLVRRKTKETIALNKHRHKSAKSLGIPPKIIDDQCAGDPFLSSGSLRGVSAKEANAAMAAAMAAAFKGEGVIPKLERRRVKFRRYADGTYGHPCPARIGTPWEPLFGGRVDGLECRSCRATFSGIVVAENAALWLSHTERMEALRRMGITPDQAARYGIGDEELVKGLGEPHKLKRIHLSCDKSWGACANHGNTERFGGLLTLGRAATRCAPCIPSSRTRMVFTNCTFTDNTGDGVQPMTRVKPIEGTIIER